MNSNWGVTINLVMVVLVIMMVVLVMKVMVLVMKVEMNLVSKDTGSHNSFCLCLLVREIGIIIIIIILITIIMTKKILIGIIMLRRNLWVRHRVALGSRDPCCHHLSLGLRLVNDYLYHDDGDKENPSINADDDYFSDNVSILSVNNSDSPDSRDLVHGFDQLSVPHHFVPGE